MRVCHMWNGGGPTRFGIYACSFEDSSFKAIFTNMEITECKWLALDCRHFNAKCLFYPRKHFANVLH